MADTLKIADDFRLPLDAITQTFAVLAKRGVGKTYTASVIAEEMLKAGQPIVAVDPTGAWWGLRSHFPVAVLGGEHGDVALEEHAGEVVAQSIVENRFPAILDLSLFRKGAMQRFMVSFLETLYRLNRDALHLFVDEADAFAPQQHRGGGVEESRLLGAMEDIVRRGRKRGVGCTLITQRPAVINKNVLTQCEVLVCLRLVHPKDIDAVEEWVNVHADPAQAKGMIESLPSLPVGTAWFWSPGWGDFFRRVEVRKRETFDSGATPRPGEAASRPKTLQKIDINALGERIRATVEKQKAEDPRELKRRIAELEKQLRERPVEAQTVEVEKLVEVPVLKNGQLERTEKLVERLEAAGQKTLSEVAELRRLIGPAAAPRPAIQKKPVPIHRPAQVMQKTPQSIHETRQSIHPVAGDDGATVGSGGMRRIMIALAQFPAGITHRKIATLSGIKRGGSTWRGIMAKLRERQWITEQGETAFVTPAGLEVLGSYDPLPEGAALIDYWRRELGEGVAGRLFGAIAAAHPRPIARPDLATAADVVEGGSTWRGGMAKLRSLELVEGDTEFRLAAELFD